MISTKRMGASVVVKPDRLNSGIRQNIRRSLEDTYCNRIVNSVYIMEIQDITSYGNGVVQEDVVKFEVSFDAVVYSPGVGDTVDVHVTRVTGIGSYAIDPRVGPRPGTYYIPSEVPVVANRTYSVEIVGTKAVENFIAVVNVPGLKGAS